MDAEKSIIVPGVADPEWSKIVDQLVDGLAAGDMPDQVIEATELLLCGYPTHKVAQKLGVPSKKIRGWLEAYPAMAMTVASGKKLLTKWRLAKLDQQFLQAVERSEEILDLDLEDRIVNSKLVATVAQHSRYIIGLFIGQKMDINVKVEEGQQHLNAKNDALSYIAEELAKQRMSGEVIEGHYKVVSAEPARTPMLTEKGESTYGQIGALDSNDEGTICHICGDRFKKLDMHVSITHQIKIREYELIFMLPDGSVKASGEKYSGESIQS